MIRKVLRLLGAALLLLATLLVAYGLFGLSKFNAYVGEFYDDRLVLFDNGLYPFMWGAAFFVFAELFRIRHAARVLAGVSAVSLCVFLWLKARAPVAVSGQQFFPDRSMLNELLIACLVLLSVALADLLISRRFRSGAGRKEVY